MENMLAPVAWVLELKGGAMQSFVSLDMKKRNGQIT